jgi:ComF family protein
LRKVLHQLKYRRDISLGDALARPFSAFARELGWDADLVIPVPLSRRRMAERGYNQVSVVALPLALELNLGYSPRSLVRIKETRSQVGLTPVARKENVHDAFRCRGGPLRGKAVLLVDDVATTGATLSSAAISLRQGGASRIFALTLARALPRQSFEST